MEARGSDDRLRREVEDGREQHERRGLPADVCGEVDFGPSAPRSILEAEVAWARHVLGMDAVA